MKINYSFQLTPQQNSSVVTDKLVEYSYNEFFLDLPPHWRQIPTQDNNTFNWYSSQEEASITVSADFYEIPEEKAYALAEKNLSSRKETLEISKPGSVSILQQTIKPHSGGVGLEMSFCAEIEGETVYLYLGYVTSRKVFNFTLVSQKDKQAASALFNQIMGNVRVKLP